jgi:cytidine deaminase
MSLETDVKAVGADIKAEFEKIFTTAKVDAVAFEGSVSAEIVKLKAAVASLDQSATVKAIEAKVDALIAKIGVKL